MLTVLFLDLILINYKLTLINLKSERQIMQLVLHYLVLIDLQRLYNKKARQLMKI